jgi:hypothetical protein
MVCVDTVFTVPAGGKVIGKNAEWIVERPGIGNGYYSQLYNYGTVNVFYASATTADAPFSRTFATSSSRAGETTYDDTMISCSGTTSLGLATSPTGMGYFDARWLNAGKQEKC